MSLGSNKVLFLIVVCGAATLFAQDISNYTSFVVEGKTVQFHGYVSQGYVYTNDNNWLTMDTSKGSFAMTDGAVNVSSQLTDKFRVGAQVYDRNLGNLGNYHPELDWAYGDYKFTNWFGVRAGKVKTTLGLYNDTQDLAFLHTFALLPQSMYPTDLRDSLIGHTGTDIYGDFTSRHGLGTLSYTAYVGHRSDSTASGYPYLLTQYDYEFTSYGGLQYGGDLRWNTPLPGLLAGVSRMDQDIMGSGTFDGQSAWERSIKDFTNQFYAQYTHRALHIDSEYRRYLRDQLIESGTATDEDNIKGWYFSGAYQVMRKLTLGSYYSHYTITSTAVLAFDTSLPQNHIYDKVVTARFDLTDNWNLKVEGHFMNGYGNAPYPDGFYPQVNPDGFKPKTIGLVILTGWNF